MEITGSAWLPLGSQSQVKFNRHELSWSLKHGPDWRLIAESDSPIRNMLIGKWDTRGVSPSMNIIRLTVHSSDDSSGYSTPNILPIAK